MPAVCPFIPAQFRKRGYHTAQVGKWHTGTDAGFGRDWDHQVVWNRPKHPANAGAFYKGQILSFDGEERWVEGYSTDIYTDLARSYIRGDRRPVNSADAAATLCGIAGVEIPWPHHGRDFGDLLADTADAPHEHGPPIRLRNRLGSRRRRDIRAVGCAVVGDAARRKTQIHPHARAGRG